MSLYLRPMSTKAGALRGVKTPKAKKTGHDDYFKSTDRPTLFYQDIPFFSQEPVLTDHIGLGRFAEWLGAHGATPVITVPADPHPICVRMVICHAKDNERVECFTTFALPGQKYTTPAAALTSLYGFIQACQEGQESLEQSQSKDYPFWWAVLPCHRTVLDGTNGSVFENFRPNVLILAENTPPIGFSRTDPIHFRPVPVMFARQTLTLTVVGTRELLPYSQESPMPGLLSQPDGLLGFWTQPLQRQQDQLEPLPWTTVGQEAPASRGRPKTVFAAHGPFRAGAGHTPSTPSPRRSTPWPPPTRRNSSVECD